MIDLNTPANSSLPDKIDQINSIFAALILLQNTPLKQGVTDATSQRIRSGRRLSCFSEKILEDLTSSAKSK